ncbi:precorrin-2 dehydrogenase/sirohydrochlorin ferrochelatase family protein [Seleniivibrio woodruffii]|uniref:precorrin-2 dehydrogenase/sirohydrochlorin ferrochelatase family protein n=1 Tax=Seleniivibrio woodruffii TaxID=1078050 RepID=UPI001644B9B5|nr:bifunctional precorrin-2 dehydrogenase/sirohydrochlorin ferrochelatase [Seleniivibrio woodruffii]
MEGDVMHPLMFRLKGRKILFVGGGKVAERKIYSMLSEGCDITVVAPYITSGIKSSGVKTVERHFEMDDIRGDYFLIFICTSDRSTNAAAAELAKSMKIPVNIADDPEYSDFHTASVIRTDDFVISISTDGKNPAKSKEMRLKIEDILKNT